MDNKIKILVSGDVNGNFKQFFSRVESINKKAGPFEILLCVGDFFGKSNDELDPYKNGFKSIPVPTYILGPNDNYTEQFYKNVENNDICSNLTYLGKKGLFTLSSGVKIAYLSGVEHDQIKSTESTFNKEDVLAVRNACLVNKISTCDYKGVDILLTSQWPFGIEHNTVNNSRLISYLIKEIKPRYHFCGLNNFYMEPFPFRHLTDNNTQLELLTRFISLAKTGNVEKQKYIYALSIIPAEKMRVMELIQKNTNEIKSPFDTINYNDFRLKKDKISDEQYFYDLQSPKRENVRRKGLGNGEILEKRARKTFDQDKCWFCLSSADVEKHLVITIGENFYLALAKGPVNDYHVLILSVTHIQSASLLSQIDWAELSKFKNALKTFFKSMGLAVCFTERNYKASHLQLNVIGIDSNCEWKIKHSFEDKAEEYSLPIETLPGLRDPSDLPQQGPYFVAELPDNTTILTRQMKQFPLHFARDVFCNENLLNCEEKVDWKDCKLTIDEEIALVKNFRNKFKEFDFTV